MNKKLTAITAIILVLILATSGCKAAADISGFEGDPAPDFQLENLDGETVTLSQLRGSPVMVNFWATWCSHCRDEVPYIQEVYEGWIGKSPSVVILTISVRESQETVRQFMDDNSLSFPVLLDGDGKVSIRYDVAAIPASFFIDKNGIIQATKLGNFLSAADIEDFLKKIIP